MEIDALREIASSSPRIRSPTRSFRRIGVKWAPIPEDEFTAFLGAEAHTTTTASAALPRAFNHYFNGDFEAAAYIAAPQIERIVREAVLAVDEPAYRLQRGQHAWTIRWLGCASARPAQSGSQ